MTNVLPVSEDDFQGKLDKYEETTTIPHRIFGGWFRSRVTCMACRHNSDTYESFLDMPLEIKVIIKNTRGNLRHFRDAKLCITVFKSSPEKRG